MFFISIILRISAFIHNLGTHQYMQFLTKLARCIMHTVKCERGPPHLTSKISLTPHDVVFLYFAKSLLQNSLIIIDQYKHTSKIPCVLKYSDSHPHLRRGVGMKHHTNVYISYSPFKFAGLLHGQRDVNFSTPFFFSFLKTSLLL